MKLEIFYEEINTKTTFCCIAFQDDCFERGKFKDHDLLVYSGVYPYYEKNFDILFICGKDRSKDFNYFLVSNKDIGKLKNKVAKFNKKYKNYKKE